MAPLLEVRDLHVELSTPEGKVHAVNGTSFQLEEGEILGVAGESGSGKSQVFLAVMGLLADNGRARGSVRFQGEELLHLSSRAMNRYRGRRMAMVFQDPMTSLNPYLKIRRQMTEGVRFHLKATRREARAKALALLERVGIPDAARRLGMYPHELSGGMRQRVTIAMALMCEPRLLVADEPTTALDVTFQAQILELLKELSVEDASRSLVTITHDMGVMAGLAHRVAVMYGGRIVETGPVDDVFYEPLHPYTRGLLESVPRVDAPSADLAVALPGQPPNLQRLPRGCLFRERCPRPRDECAVRSPSLLPLDGEHAVACHEVNP